jgi:hypothetical protein
MSVVLGKKRPEVESPAIGLQGVQVVLLLY